MTLDGVLVGVFIIVVVYTIAVRLPFLTLENRQERTAVDIGWNLDSGKFKERRCIVDILYHSRRVPLHTTGQTYQERCTERFLVHPALVEPTVLTHIKALVGGVDDKRVVHKPLSLEIIEYTTHIAVDRCYHAQVVAHILTVAITLEEGDQLVNVIRTNGSDNILLATANGMAICFSETDVRPMGRDAAGVRGILLSGDDYVIGAEKAEEGKTLLTVTENGFGKRTELVEYFRTGPDGEKIPQSRGGKGLKNYNITAKTGFVAGCCTVAETDDVMLIENGGVIIRVKASGINIYKRDVQGVIVMRIEEGNQLGAIQRVEAEEEEEATE